MKLISLAIFLKNLTENSIDMWMQVREEEGALKGYWEFPGGNIENGETPKTAAIREVQEEVDLNLKEEQVTKFNHFTFKEIEFFTFIVIEAKPQEHQGKWFTINFNDVQSSLPEKIPPANIDLIQAITRAFSRIAPQDFGLAWTR